MSRIGNRPIKIPEGVKVDITDKKITAISGENRQEMQIPAGIFIVEKNSELVCSRKNDEKAIKALHGLAARMLKNVIIGVKEGFSKELQFTGTGYRVAVSGEEVVLNMGYSHEIKLNIPKTLSVAVKKNSIMVTGEDKQLVGQFAAQIRSVRPPEVYKGKGIKYKDEFIKRKAGKKAAAA